MSIPRIFAIAFIYALAFAGWMVLGTVTIVRSNGSDRAMTDQVAQLWGGPLTQSAPTVFTIGADGNDGPATLPASSTIVVDLDLDYRRKGLVWYPTYTSRFQATYTLSNPSDRQTHQRFRFHLPAGEGTYDGFAVTLNGRPSSQLVDPNAGVLEDVVMEPGATCAIAIRYSTRGLGTWRYQPGAHLGRVRDLNLTVHSNAHDIDLPDGGLSPNTIRDSKDGGRDLHWETSELITHQDFAVAMPERLNPGPLASRITFFAPVCLGFFFLLVAAITVVCRIPIHPMHYLFIAGGFFAFHLLLAYLVDVVDIHLAFALAGATTLLLVTTYLRSALGKVFPTLAALGGQAFFLILFSYSFFLEGTTGLTVAVGSVATLAFLMRLTAKVDWNTVFVRPTIRRARESAPELS